MVSHQVFHGHCVSVTSFTDVNNAKSQDGVHKPQLLKTEKGEPKRNRAKALLLQYQPNALPLGQTGSMGVRL